MGGSQKRGVQHVLMYFCRRLYLRLAQPGLSKLRIFFLGFTAFRAEVKKTELQKKGFKNIVKGL